MRSFTRIEANSSGLLSGLEASQDKLSSTVDPQAEILISIGTICSPNKPQAWPIIVINE